MKGRAVLTVMGAMLCGTVYGAQLQVVVRIDVQRGCQLVGTPAALALSNWAYWISAAARVWMTRPGP